VNAPAADPNNDCPFGGCITGNCAGGACEPIANGSDPNNFCPRSGELCDAQSCSGSGGCAQRCASGMLLAHCSDPSTSDQCIANSAAAVDAYVATCALSPSFDGCD
jgi:hypothetical protein